MREPEAVCQSAMDRVTILRNGVELPRIGLGTFRSSLTDVGPAVKAALQIGIRHIDTASIYRNQEAIGRAIKASGVPRSEVFITSKISPYEQGRDKAQAACKDILQKLDTNYVDLMLVHWPGASKTSPDSHLNAQLRTETWRVLEEFYRQGVFRAIGVSNYEGSHLRELMGLASVLPTVNQFEVHPRRPATATREACREAGVAVVAYASLGAGDLLDSPMVKSLAQRLGKTPAQVLLRWGLLKDCAVIPKSIQAHRIAEFSEQLLIGSKAWSQGQDNLLLAELDSMDDGHKYCWDASGVR